MRLDADDKLAEDVWEYIIPIIHERKYDFAAFSYYTWYENGKVVPQELPLEEESSEDIHLARSFMYASSDFNACWGKLFSKDIIEKNKICFRKDLPIGEDFLFVAEYFSYCNNVYMSKAKVLYYLQISSS